ncbi:MAG: pyruvate dehydrogenase complex dihydrolipoamide acetyltransferase [Rickettsiaceae bacterium]|nr:pyruvate dehydrogenase complex dihydrolipoamide acetyltransferase [Rickettsiaceae bacterium]
MIIEILMPALSPTMTEGNLAKWLKNEGDKIKPGDVIAEIETDKATMEVEAVDEGILARILVSPGTEGVEVNSVIALILEEGADKALLQNYTPKGKTSASSSAASSPAPTVSSGEASKTTQQNTTPVTDNKAEGGRIFASPLARRVACQNNIDLSEIKGSGPHGRIIKDDVLSAGLNPSASASQKKVRVVEGDGGYDLLPITNMRKIIAKRLLESKITVPHFYLNVECNLDKLMVYRLDVNENLEKHSKISVNDFIIKAVAAALVKVPDANSSWSDEGIMRYRDVDIAVAVATEGGLVTPIIRSANFKTITEISEEMKELASRARVGKLKPEEYQGGGFSISNLGMYGIKQFSAIINPPQGCILAVGAGIKKPVVIDDQVRISTTAEMTLSIDHRVIDGAVGARFLSYFKEYMENPIKMLI